MVLKRKSLRISRSTLRWVAGEHGKLVASNVSSGKKFEVKTPDVVIKD